jgi:putative Mg2+ transporter-C (MgtC) family protein
VLLQLVVTLALTGVLGWERELRERAAGLRTHMLVGLSTTLFVSLGLGLAMRFADAFDRVDPLRLVEAVVAGVSFLGAGTIFVSRGREVRGLTTAASLLATAAVGVAVGFERYGVAVGATLLILLVLAVLRRFEPQPRPPGEKARILQPAQADTSARGNNDGNRRRENDDDRGRGRVPLARLVRTAAPAELGLDPGGRCSGARRVGDAGRLRPGGGPDRDRSPGPDEFEGLGDLHRRVGRDRPAARAVHRRPRRRARHA